MTFGQLADEYLAMKAKEFSGKNKGKQLQKVSTQLYRYAYPTLKDMLVGDVRIHIERVMDRAITRDLCRNRNPASLKALQGLLPTPRGKKAFKSTHRPALPVKDLPRFHAQLMGNGTLGSHALAFQILTATRPGEARYAKWDDIDFDNRVWYVPAEDMKQGEAHEVPLSEPAIRILETMGRQGQYIFSNDGKKPISENTANIRIKAIHRKDLENGEPGFLDPLQDKIATAHGFRSTFKDWTIEFTQYRDELSEAALAHQVGDDTRNAYARSKQTEQRRPMMEDWAAYCLSLLEQESSSELPACA